MKLTSGRKASLKKKLKQKEKELKKSVASLSEGSSVKKMLSMLDIKSTAIKPHSPENRLRSVYGALDKIQKGSYGVCEGCGEKIGFSRLEILPHAPLCIECKREEEIKET